MLKVIVAVVVVIVLEAIACAVFVFSGTYNVSTDNHDTAFVNWWLARGATRAVKHHARGLNAPDLTSPAMVQEGFKEYNEMCVECHGAPGKQPEEIAKGLWPKAPDLAKTSGDWTPAQIFWITKNGIKFSAMPGWGKTHSDHAIWAMTAFIEKLPKMSPADYQEMETNTVSPEVSKSHGEGDQQHLAQKP